MSDYAAMLALDRLATTDPLGLRGLLLDACRVHQMIERPVRRAATSSACIHFVR